MTRLRQMRLEELERRNYATRTIESYLHAVRHFLRQDPQKDLEYERNPLPQEDIQPADDP